MSSVQSQPLIAVADVAAASRWYQQLLGCAGGHGGAEYERLVAADGRLLLQLHAWDAHEHPHLGDASTLGRGNGVLLWFQVDDFTAALERVRALAAVVLEGPHVNPNARHREIWLRDRDGYVVVLAGATGDL